MTKPRYWWILGLLVVMSLVVVIASRTSRGPQPSAQSALRIASTLAVGSKAPAFQVTAIDGRHYSLDNLKGKTVILFAMFANCADCIPEGQVLSQIQQAYAGKDVAVLGIDIVSGEAVSLLQQFQKVGHITIPLAAYSAEIVQQYQLTQPEMTYVIGADGIIKHRNAQSLGYADFQRELDGIL